MEHPNSGRQLNNKKEKITDIYNDLDDSPEYYAEFKNPIPKGY